MDSFKNIQKLVNQLSMIMLGFHQRESILFSKNMHKIFLNYVVEKTMQLE